MNHRHSKRYPHQLGKRFGRHLGVSSVGGPRISKTSPEGRARSAYRVLEASLRLRCPHSRPAVRLEAAELLKDVCKDSGDQNAEVAEALGYAVQNDADDEVQAVAVEALAALGPKAAAQAELFPAVLLGPGFSSRAQEAAITAMEALGPAAVPYLESLQQAALTCVDPAMRRKAAEALHSFSGEIEVHVKRLGQTLRQDPGKVMRLRAAQALKHLGKEASPCSNDLAQAALYDPEVGVRTAASDVVPELSFEAACSAKRTFEDALNQGDASIRKAAAKALCNLSAVQLKEVEAYRQKKIAEETRHYYNKLMKMNMTDGNKMKGQPLPSPTVMVEEPPREEEPQPAEGEEESFVMSSEMSMKGESSSMKRESSSMKRESSSMMRENSMKRASSLFRTTSMMLRWRRQKAETSRPEACLKLLADMAVEDDDDAVRYHSAEALARLGGNLSQRYLTRLAEIAVRNKNPTSRQRAAAALAVTGEFRAAHAGRMARFLQKASGSEAVDSPKEGLTADPVAVQSAVAALRELGTPALSHRGALVTTMHDGMTTELRAEAARSLGALQTPRASQASELASVAAQAGSFRLQCEAARALGKLGSRGSTSAGQLASSLVSLQTTQAVARCSTPVLRADQRCMTPSSLKAGAIGVLCKWESSLNPD